MSEENNSVDSTAHNDSTTDSATDTRTQPRRFEPITHDQDNDDGEEESTRTTGTIRRNRPPAISTRSGDNYGMFSSKVEECY